MRKSSDVAAILLGIVLFLVVLGILIVLARQKNAPQVSQNELTPTPSQTGTGMTATTTTTAPGSGKPPVFYSKSATDKLLSAMEKKEPLSQTDVIAKANILTLLPARQPSGVVFKNNLISIEYVYTADLFMVEILTTDISAAKSAANIWFRSHGISQQAICKMPVDFYINYDVSMQLRGKNLNFSPLGNGC